MYVWSLLIFRSSLYERVLCKHKQKLPQEQQFTRDIDNALRRKSTM